MFKTDNALNEQNQFTAPWGYLCPNIIVERQLNTVPMDVFSRLMMDRIIFLGCPIDDTVANIIQAQLLFLNSVDSEKEISLYINSPGGSVSAGLGIYDTMRLIKAPVATICTGVAASMAAVLLCAGAPGRRAVLPHSRVMIHQPMGGVQGQASDMLIEIREMERLRDGVYEIISNHTGQPFDKVFTDSDRNFWMNAEEALSYRMVDSILVSQKTKQND